DMGFAEDLEAILSAAPAQRQTVLFSATMPSKVNHMVRKHLNDPVRILIAREKTAAGEAPKVRQTAYVVARPHKAAALGRVLDIEAPVATIVFCRTREDVDGLTETLNGRGYRAEALHGGLSQEQRDRVMGRLRSGTAELLDATDVDARGLDLDQLTHVVNYDVPNAAESYVHRIGRVGRAGREGVAVTLAEPRERRMLLTIERTTGQKISIEPVPTVEDLRSKRLDQTAASLRAALAGDDLEQVSAVVDALSADHGLREIALAAVRLLHDAGGPADEHEIPDAPKGAPSSSGAPARPGTRPDSRGPSSRPETRGSRASGVHRTTGEPMAKLFIGIGRNAGMRPQDVVGAVAGETRLSGKDVGVIEILERFTLVEVPEAAADEVVDALRGTMIRGGTPTVRRDGKR
ncbi:MAG: box helicase domain protein, partial [Frankiales bacterium]|nr:box helicase domain protein [Frankiales bacterium]